MKRAGITRNKIKGVKLGFTLIELVLVIGILAITFGVTSDILISLVRSQAKTKIMNNVEQSANFITLKMERELRSAEDVIAPYDLSLPDSYRLKRRSDGVYVVYYVSTGRLIRTEFDGLTGDPHWNIKLNETTGVNGVTISCIPGNLCFTVSGTDPKVINISLRVTASSTGGLPVNNAYTDVNETIVVRATY